MCSDSVSQTIVEIDIIGTFPRGDDSATVSCQLPRLFDCGDYFAWRPSDILHTIWMTWFMRRLLTFDPCPLWLCVRRAWSVTIARPLPEV